MWLVSCDGCAAITLYVAVVFIFSTNIHLSMYHRLCSCTLLIDNAESFGQGGRGGVTDNRKGEVTDFFCGCVVRSSTAF